MTGANPDDIEELWSEESVHGVLLTHQAQQMARVMIARRDKAMLMDVIAPTSIVVSKDSDSESDDEKEKPARKRAARKTVG